MPLPSGSNINIERRAMLCEYLLQAGYLRQGEDIEVKILRGGVSNRTVYLATESGRTWVLKQALKKLRVATEWLSHPRRILNEARAMQWLKALCPAGSIPSFVFLDEEQYILAMEAVPEPNANFKELLLSGDEQPDYFRQFGHLLGTIHFQAQERKPEIEQVFADVSFFKNLRLEPYYEYTGRKLPEAQVFLNELSHTSLNNRYTLVHGDYSPKNILIHREQLILLDHEVAHFGDGTFDIGFALTHLLSKANHLVARRPGMIAGAQSFWQAYREAYSTAWSPEKEARAVAHTLACLLARVHGRSPLEYLKESAKKRQTRIALASISNPPDSIPELIHQFDQNLQHA